MKFETAAIEGVLIVRPVKHGDARGFFSETFKQSAFAEAGVTHGWVQDNHAFSARRGVVRGLHFQAPPFAQAKLLRVTRGAVLDVVVDIRKGSPTYGKHAAVELSAENWAQIYVPVGFAHGYATLTEECEVLYRVSSEYAPMAEGGLRWNDPALGIDWPVRADEAQLTGRDKNWGDFEKFESPF